MAAVTHYYRRMSDRDSAKQTLGEAIRAQRELASLPMRRLAEMVGISNPYLSQIERNLRKPSDQVLGSIAEHLKLSADILTESIGPSAADDLPNVVAAIRQDGDLTRTQRAALEEMYTTFREGTLANRRRGRGTGRGADGSSTSSAETQTRPA